MAPRRTLIVVLITILIAAACDAASSPPSSVARTSAPAPSASTGTPVPSLTPSAEPTARPSASAPLGTLVGSIEDGRILIGIEGSNGASFAYIDATGVHDIATEPDRTMAHGVWASSDTVVFDSERAGSRHLFRMGIGDGVVTRMTTGSGQERASVSSDGQRVVSDNFDPSSHDRDLGLRTWSLAGVAIDAVTSPGDAAGVSGATQASFSPDGRSIAFVQKSDFNADRGAIFVVDAAGGEPRRLTPDADHVGYPRWSPDGGSILYTQGAGPLLIIDMDSGKVRPLVDPGQGSVAFEGDWSPDGTQIAYAYWNPGLDQNQLWIASSDGTHQRALWVGYTAGIGTPDWGP